MKTLLKTVLFIVLSVSLLLCAVSCDKESDPTSNPNQTSTPTCSHQWLDANCTKAKRCWLCSETIGVALGHNGEWSEWDIDYYDAVNTRELTCTKCEEVVETQEEPVTTFINGRYFTIYPYAFAQRFEESSSQLNGIDYYAETEYSDDMLFFDEENYVYTASKIRTIIT